MKHEEIPLREEKIYDGPVFDVRRYAVALEDGSTASREVIGHNGGAVILAFQEDQLLMVRQYRFPIAAEMLELPAGKLEQGEDPRLAAIRELEEETGYLAREMKLMTVCHPSPGFCREALYLYRAGGLTPTAQHLDEGEFLTVEPVPFEKAVELVLNGSITDGKTQVGILMEYARRCREEKRG